MSLTETIGRLLGYENVSTIDEVRPSFGAEWAHDGPAWVLFGCLALAALAFVFYTRYQPRGGRTVRLLLAGGRAVVLCLMLLILADPILELKFTSHPRPLLWLLFDGTDSMAIQDNLPTDVRAELASATELPQYLGSGATGQESVARADYVRALLRKSDGELLRLLSEKFRLRGYLFDGPDGVRALQLNKDDSRTAEPDSGALVGQLTTSGEVTALGNAFEDLSGRYASDSLAGVLVVSDFDQNSGTGAVDAAKKLGVPVFTLGVGPGTAMDLSIDLHAPLTMKRAESSTLGVTLRQRELEGASVVVRLTARNAEGADAASGDIVVGERTVALHGTSVSVEFPFTPESAGRFVFTAEVAPVQGETVEQNNRAEREVRIIDDFLRLMFVEYEPTWEWRFIKEVFHRDKLVGTRGFRTYLRSADPVVRETNELFLPSLTLPRSEFFAHDVIFLGDMPAATLSTRFCEMVKEFVGQFGGGLVVIAGPRFGPGELNQTPLADMLPVVLDPDARLRDDREFELKLSPMASQYDFMRLGQNDVDNAKAWQNLGQLPWYQPVKRLEPRASAILAEHPTDTLADGRTPQPLVAIRKYGRGEVVYVAFNEMWRLRRRFGEEYYRQFWGQLIHRLGLSHALGSQKRFVVRTDRQQYRADEKALLTVEAYDKDFNPLSEEDLPGRTVRAELIRPSRDGAGPSAAQSIALAQTRPGVFETRVPVFDGGEYRVQVTDPVSKEVSEVHFEVTALSAERRSAVRNVTLQQGIAAATNGKTYELSTVSRFPAEFNPPRLTETRVEIFPLWSTWLCFLLGVLLLLGEWLARKLVNLA